MTILSNKLMGGAETSNLGAAAGAERLYIIGGILLIAGGMLFGDLFAILVLHQNANRIGGEMIGAVRAVSAQDTAAVLSHFTVIGSLIENRGTKVDAHVHAIDFGYLALILALVQPYVAMTDSAKRRIALLFLFGAVMLPVSVFIIHYIGTQYGPSDVLGWASVSADFGGLLVIIASALLALGLFRGLRRRKPAVSPSTADHSGGKALLVGGALLILAGFVHGAYYAAFDLSRHEASDTAILTSMIDNAVSNNLPAAEADVESYGKLAGERAVNIAAHSHIIEFGLLAILLSFLQQYIRLSPGVRRFWIGLFFAGSVILPVFVFLEIRLGLLAGGIADFGGALVLLALIAMLVGVLRQKRTSEGGLSA